MLDPNLVVSETKFWEAAVSTAEQRFHKLCDEAEAMSIQGYLQDGTVVYWNRASEMIYGYSAQEAIGRNLLDLIIPPAAWAVVQHDMAQMFETGKGRKEHSRRSMVSLIRFSAEQPKDLEHHLIDRRSLQGWPGAALMMRIWEEIVGGKTSSALPASVGLRFAMFADNCPESLHAF